MKKSIISLIVVDFIAIILSAISLFKFGNGHISDVYPYFLSFFITIVIMVFLVTFLFWVMDIDYKEVRTKRSKSTLENRVKDLELEIEELKEKLKNKVGE